MAPSYRISATTRRGNRSNYPEHDDFEGLPVRQWRHQRVLVEPPQSALAGDAKTNSIWANELPYGLPKEWHLLPSHTQELLRAARSGSLYKRRAPVVEEEEPEAGAAGRRDANGNASNANGVNGVDGVNGGSGAATSTVASGEPKKRAVTVTNSKEGTYKARAWKPIPREIDAPLPSHLAKRRKNTVVLPPRETIDHGAANGGSGTASHSMPMVTVATVRRTDANGHTVDQTVTLVEGQPVDGQILSSRLVPAASSDLPPLAPAAPSRRRNPPPRRKGKIGRGRKKGIMPIGLQRSRAAAAAAAAASGTVDSAAPARTAGTAGTAGTTGTTGTAATTATDVTTLGTNGKGTDEGDGGYSNDAHGGHDPIDETMEDAQADEDGKDETVDLTMAEADDSWMATQIEDEIVVNTGFIPEVSVMAVDKKTKEQQETDKNDEANGVANNKQQSETQVAEIADKEEKMEKQPDQPEPRGEADLKEEDGLIVEQPADVEAPIEVAMDEDKPEYEEDKQHGAMKEEVGDKDKTAPSVEGPVQAVTSAFTTPAITEAIVELERGLEPAPEMQTDLETEMELELMSRSELQPETGLKLATMPLMEEMTPNLKSTPDDRPMEELTDPVSAAAPVSVEEELVSSSAPIVVGEPVPDTAPVDQVMDESEPTREWISDTLMEHASVPVSEPAVAIEVPERALMLEDESKQEAEVEVVRGELSETKAGAEAQTAGTVLELQAPVAEPVARPLGEPIVEAETETGSVAEQEFVAELVTDTQAEWTASLDTTDNVVALAEALEFPLDAKKTVVEAKAEETKQDEAKPEATLQQKAVADPVAVGTVVVAETLAPEPLSAENELAETDVDVANVN